MSWLSRVRNGIQSLTKRQSADNLWHKCRKCESMVFTKEWEDNGFVCPRCDHHDRVGPKVRFDALFDRKKYEQICRAPRSARIRSSSATPSAIPTASRPPAPRPASATR